MKIDVLFIVVDTLASYNAILGRITINDNKIILSKCNQRWNPQLHVESEKSWVTNPLQEDAMSSARGGKILGKPSPSRLKSTRGNKNQVITSQRSDWDRGRRPRQEGEHWSYTHYKIGWCINNIPQGVQGAIHLETQQHEHHISRLEDRSHHWTDHSEDEVLVENMRLAVRKKWETTRRKFLQRYQFSNMGAWTCFGEKV